MLVRRAWHNQPALFLLPRFHFRAVRSAPPCLSPLSPGQRVGYVLVYSVQGNIKWHPSILCFSSLPCPSAVLPEPCLQLWLQAQRLSLPAAGSLPRQEDEGIPWSGFPPLWCAFMMAASAPRKLGYSPQPFGAGRGDRAPANKGPAGGKKGSSNQQHVWLLCQASPRQTWHPSVRVPENSVATTYCLVGFGMAESWAWIKALYVWSGHSPPSHRTSYSPPPQKPYLQLCLLSGCMSRGKCRTSLKSTITRRVLSKCRDCGKLALYLVVVVKPEEWSERCSELAVPFARGCLNWKQLVVRYRSSKGIAVWTQEEIEARG